MNGVDKSNQLRKNYTVYQRWERRNWRPHWYYILDVCTVNAYLIWKETTQDTFKRGQRPFRELIANILLSTPYPEAQIYAKKHVHRKAMSSPKQDNKEHH
jgi:hypothetical protein